MKLIYVDDSAFDQMAFKRLMKSFQNVEYEMYSSFNELEETHLIQEESILIRDCYLGDASDIDFKGSIYFVSGGKLTEKLKNDLHISEDSFFQKPLNKSHINSMLTHSGIEEPDDEPDLSYLKELSDGDEVFEKEMRQVYIVEIPVQLSDALSFLQNKEYRRFSETIHALRTKLRTFGLIQLDEIAGYLESESRKEGLIPDDSFKEKLDVFKERLISSVSKMEQV